jgi:hypothetical protein
VKIDLSGKIITRLHQNKTLMMKKMTPPDINDQNILIQFIYQATSNSYEYRPSDLL